MVTELTRLCNTCWTTRTMPEEWNKRCHYKGAEKRELERLRQLERYHLAVGTGQSDVLGVTTSLWKPVWTVNYEKNKRVLEQVGPVASRSLRFETSLNNASNIKDCWPSTSLISRKRLTVCIERHCGTLSNGMACQTSLPAFSEACTATQAAVCEQTMETQTFSKSSAASGRAGHRLCHETRDSRAESRHSVDSWQPIDRFGLCR